MKKLSEKYCIVFEETGPTGRYETVKVEIREAGTIEVLEIEAIERRDTLNGHIAFFRAVLAELEELRRSKLNEII